MKSIPHRIRQPQRMDRFKLSIRLTDTEQTQWDTQNGMSLQYRIDTATLRESHKNGILAILVAT